MPSKLLEHHHPSVLIISYVRRTVDNSCGKRTLRFIVLILDISACIVHVCIIIVIVIKVVFLSVQLGLDGESVNLPLRLLHPNH